MIAYTVMLRVAHVLEDDETTRWRDDESLAIEVQVEVVEGRAWWNEAERVGRRVNGA